MRYLQPLFNKNKMSKIYYNVQLFLMYNILLIHEHVPPLMPANSEVMLFTWACMETMETFELDD